ncbi:MAG: sigma-54 dependent transcriptional regulator, partial [Gemmatimonadetes bacterium]|nr:sigma-54 dependent transcriptional regulator [Gemmatimonadota bacterium]
MSARVLVVDDDPSIRETFEHHLRRTGHEVAVAATAEEALAALSDFEPTLVITDVRMPGMGGLELLRRVREAGDVQVVVITAYEGMKSAVAAMREGAYDYLTKPLDLDRIDLLVERSERDRALQRRVRNLTAETSEGHDLDELIGQDPKMIDIYKLIGVLARNRATVLVTGETGTGKERIARAIHFNSPAAEEPFVAVNCTAIPDPLLESELFGHTRGAFTGAIDRREGYFELAGSGTIFLDEIGDTTREFQAKLLRVLEDREFYPVGGERPHRLEARVIAATQRSLETEVREGRFRDDLFYRLQVVEIEVPPLRERRGDIRRLVEHLLAKLADELHTDVRGITDGALRRLTTYGWPGNVRELEHALTRAMVVCRGPVIDVEHLSLGAVQLDTGPEAAPADDSMNAIEATHVQRILDRTGGNKRETARVLRISRPRLDRLIEKHH